MKLPPFTSLRVRMIWHKLSRDFVWLQSVTLVFKSSMGRWHDKEGYGTKFMEFIAIRPTSAIVELSQLKHLSVRVNFE